MQPGPGELAGYTEPNKAWQPADYSHADRTLLAGQAERGALRAVSPAALQKFKAAAHKVVVTHEVMDMLRGCQQELRQAQQDFKGERASAGQITSEVPAAPAAAKSMKAWQIEAVAAADAAATYSLRSAERGKAALPSDSTTAGAAAQERSRLPADWGFLRNVDNLHAAPPAAVAAARLSPEAVQRPSQPYLSYDAATKAAHEAWQPPEDPSWRQVLSKKKFKQANKSQLEEAEREQAAQFIQANWMLYKHRKAQQLLNEQQLTAWAESHYAAAAAGRLKLTPEAAAAGTAPEDGLEPASTEPDGADQTQTVSPYRRRVKTEPEQVKPRSKPVVQPWSRMVGREAPINTTAATPISNSKKWRGAVSDAMAANRLAAMVTPGEDGVQHAAGDGSQEPPASSPHPEVLLQEVQPLDGSRCSSSAGGTIRRTSSSVPISGKVTRTSSTAAALAHLGSSLMHGITSLLGPARGHSTSGSTNGATSSSTPVDPTATSGASDQPTGEPPQTGTAFTRLGRRLSVDLSAFFGGGTPAPPPAAPHRHAGPSIADSSHPSRLTSRQSTDLSALFGNSSTTQGQHGSSPAARRGSLDLRALLGGGARTPADEACSSSSRTPLAPAPPAGPPHPPTRRRSVEFVCRLFRRNSVEMQQPHGGPAVPGPSGAVASSSTTSRFVTADSCEASQLPSPLLSGCVTARTSWSDAADGGSKAAVQATDLAARGAAAAAAYLEAASRAVADSGAPQALGQAMAGSRSKPEQQQEGPESSRRASLSLNGGVAGVSAAADGQAGLLCSSSEALTGGMATAGAAATHVADAASSFESIWSKIQSPMTVESSTSVGSMQATSPSALPPPDQLQNLSTGAAAAAAVAAATATNTTGNCSVETPATGPQQPGKPRVVGQGQVTFQVDKPVLVTAADISSGSSNRAKQNASFKAAPVDVTASSLYQPTSSFKAPPPPTQPAAAASSSCVNRPAGSSTEALPPAAHVDVTSSSLYQPTTSLTAAASNTRPTGSSRDTAQTSEAAAAAAASAGQGVPAAAPGSTAAGKSRSVMLGSSAPLLSVQVSSAPHSPPALSAAASPQSPASPSRSQHHNPQQQQQQQQQRSAKAPQPPKEPISPGGGSSRPVPWPHLFVRSNGLKSNDLAADVAAALAQRASTEAALAQPATAAAAGAAGQQAGSTTAAARSSSAGMSSVSQKLAIARRMAATAVAEGDQEAADSSPSGAAALSFQLDGSIQRHNSNTRRPSGGRQQQASPGQLAITSSSSRSSSQAAASSASPGILKATGRASSAAAGPGSRKAWAADGGAAAASSSPPAPQSPNLTTNVAAGFLGRGSPPASPTALRPTGRDRSAAAAGQREVLPGLSILQHSRGGSSSPDGKGGAVGHGAGGTRGVATAGGGRGAARGRDSGGGWQAAGGVQEEPRPRRNSYSNDGSNPVSGCSPGAAAGAQPDSSKSAAMSGRADVAVAGAALRPSSGVKGAEALRRLSAL